MSSENNHQLLSLYSNLLKVLANSKRLEIIHLLRNQSLTVSELQSMTAIPQANLSQHLSLLRENKIVSAKRDGKEIHYLLTHPELITACDIIRQTLLKQHSSPSLNTPLSAILPTVTDPICGMHLSPSNTLFSLNYQDIVYYFCASGCLHTFQKQHNIKKNISKSV